MNENNEFGGEAMPEEQSQPGGGYCIELYISADGTMTVSSEQREPEENGEQPGEPVESLGAAIDKIIELYNAGGDSTAGEAAFDEGYGATMREGE